jgi:hypothetical protein
MNKYKITNGKTRSEAICWGISPNHAVLNLLALTGDNRQIAEIDATGWDDRIGGAYVWEVVVGFAYKGQNVHHLEVEELHEEKDA